MRTVLLTVLLFLAVAQPVGAEKAPLSPEGLRQAAGLIVVGKIEEILIGTERSRIEGGFGNYDWTIDLTIKIERIEKGRSDESDTVVARCFRIKSRKSATEFLSPSGHRPIPDVGTVVRAHLCGRGDAFAAKTGAKLTKWS